ncbi:hypothetical protein ABVK25_003989 [Lepraria finkii]|uniref:Uncharacterized protein n=1 Tax=Lepraria finkii TaxID=1340010 RepID=A0ABR4BD72_9LECA
MCLMPRYVSLWGQAKVGHRKEFVVPVSSTPVSGNGTVEALVERELESAIAKPEPSTPSLPPTNLSLAFNGTAIVPTCYAPSRPSRTINSDDCNIAIYMILIMPNSMEPMTWDKPPIYLPRSTSAHAPSP